MSMDITVSFLSCSLILPRLALSASMFTFGTSSIGAPSGAWFVAEILQPLPRYDRTSVCSHGFMSRRVGLSDDAAVLCNGMQHTHVNISEETSCPSLA
jgi:hypothetical protein